MTNTVNMQLIWASNAALSASDIRVLGIKTTVEIYQYQLDTQT